MLIILSCLLVIHGFSASSPCRSGFYGYVDSFLIIEQTRTWKRTHSHSHSHTRSSSSSTTSASKYPVNEGTIQVSRTKNDEDNNIQNAKEEYDLSYRIVRPMSLSSMKAAPIVVLHGGPSLPADYLFPLADVIPYRSIVFYDQIGCGRSDEPTDQSLYSIDNAVDDLQSLIQKLGIRRFHLYGQSFGGILAYEYLKRLCCCSGDEDSSSKTDDVECLSVVLSSAPSDVAQVEQVVNRLVEELPQNPETEDIQDIEQAFSVTHQCRIDPKPKPLQDAYKKAGTTWRGTTAIANYRAVPVGENCRRMPSALILRGEHDFVTNECIESWKGCWNHKFVRYKTLPGCAHHGLLEQPQLYGETIESYFAEYD